MTAEELRAVEARYRQSTEQAEAARAERNAAIRAALSEGWTQTQVARAMDLTRGRVGQLAKQS